MQIESISIQTSLREIGQLYMYDDSPRMIIGSLIVEMLHVSMKCTGVL